MNSIALKTINVTPVGCTIFNQFKDLGTGNYALIPDRNGRTKLLKKTESAGTDFFKHIKTVNYPFYIIAESNLFPKYSVELNASPAGSESQEYAKDSLVFHVE